MLVVAGTAAIGHPIRLLGAADVRRLAEEHRVRPTKTRGQNFVVDANTVRRIVRASGVEANDTVLEVGPGLGSLTLALLERVRSVIAVEVDATLAEALPATIADFAPYDVHRLEVLHEDALALTGIPGPEPTALVANLPYNVAVPVLLHLLEQQPSLTRGLVMVQAEVAARLVAGPGSRTYGVPSLKAAWYADLRPAGTVARSVFWPVPNVDSALVSWVRRDAPGPDHKPVFAVIDAAFAQRRKTLRAALASLAGSPAAAERALRSADVSPGARGESLDLAAFVRVADALEAESTGATD